MKATRCLFLIFILIFFAYYDLPLSFFQQEEWHNLVFQKEFAFFGLNFSAYAWLSILLHLVNSFLVFYLARLFFQRESLALISALMFGLNSFSHQAVSWAASAGSTQITCLFLLLLLIFLVKKQLFKKLFIPFLIFALFYCGLRGQVYFYRLLALPFKLLPQSLISARQILSWAEALVRLAHPQFFVASDGSVNPDVLETIAFDLICFLLAVIFFLGVYFFYSYLRRRKKHCLATNLIFFLSLILASGLPLIFIPGSAGYVSVLESRKLYMAGIGSSLFLALTIFVVSEWLASRIGRSLRLKKKFLLLGFLSAFLVPLLFVHLKNIRQDMEQQIINSQLRRSILDKIKTAYPDLPERVVFYTKSDCSYYGFRDDEMILPFQSGFGHILLVWYSKSEEFPLCFYKNAFLDEITSQGYRFCQKRGFGYFRYFNELVAMVKKENLPMESVYGFEWRCKQGKLFDVTDLVRQDIAKF